MAAQYSYVMKGLTKTYPGAPKPVLNGIHLQFYPDAKIGIVGPNGTGKSTLMKIMAGRDTEFVGEAWAGQNITVGYLEQALSITTDPALEAELLSRLGVAADHAGRYALAEASLRRAADLARETGDRSRAAAAILTAREQNLASREKPDRSPVTAADEAPEAVILSDLARLLPGMPVISE